MTAAYQRQLIDAAVPLLKPGGTMVYSTCTFFPGKIFCGNTRYVYKNALMHYYNYWLHAGCLHG